MPGREGVGKYFKNNARKQGKGKVPVAGQLPVTALIIVRVRGLKQEQRNRKLRKQEAEGIRT